MVKIAGDEVCPRHSDSRALWVTDGGKRIRLGDNAYVNQKVEVESESRLSPFASVVRSAAGSTSATHKKVSEVMFVFVFG